MTSTPEVLQYCPPLLSAWPAALGLGLLGTGTALWCGGSPWLGGRSAETEQAFVVRPVCTIIMQILLCLHLYPCTPLTSRIAYVYCTRRTLELKTLFLDRLQHHHASYSWRRRCRCVCLERGEGSKTSHPGRYVTYHMHAQRGELAGRRGWRFQQYGNPSLVT